KHDRNDRAVPRIERDLSGQGILPARHLDLVVARRNGRETEPSIRIDYGGAPGTHRYDGALQRATPLIDHRAHDFRAAIEWPAVVLNFDIHAAGPGAGLAYAPSTFNLHPGIQVVGSVENLVRTGAAHPVVRVPR